MIASQISDSALDTRCQSGKTSTLAISTWLPITDPPDDEITVLLYQPGADEPVWPGYKSGDEWLWACGATAHPTHWQHLPLPPNPFTNYQ